MELLTTLLTTPSPAGHERAAADELERYAARFAQVTRDALGSCIVRRAGATGPRVAICGHLDEIGLVVTRIEEQGFLRFDPIGSWDPAVFVGQRVTLIGTQGPVSGVIGRAAIHLLRQDGSDKKAPACSDLWIDILVEDGDAARELVGVGTPGVLDSEPVIANGRIMSRSLDNRLGTIVALEVLRRAHDIAADVIAVATVQEEIGGAGATTVAYGLDLDAAIIVDLSPASDTPAGHPSHVLKVGGGPGLNRGSTNNERLVAHLAGSAGDADIAVQMRGLGSRTSTDTDRIVSVGGGVPCAFISIPARYVHTPGEVASLADVDHVVQLIDVWLRDTYGIVRS